MQGFLGLSFGEAPSDGYVLTYNAALGRYKWSGTFPAAALSGMTANQVAVGTSAGGLSGSSGLTFNGTTLSLTGAMSLSGQLTSTLAPGTAPFVVSSTTVVANLNVSQLLGSTWASPAAIGSGTPAAGSFTTLTTSDSINATTAASHTFTVSDSTTSGTASPVIYKHLTSGTPAAGFGIEIDYYLDTTTHVPGPALSVIPTWTDATFASRKARATYVVWDAAGARECIRLEANGSVPALSFYGANAVVQYATTGTATGFTAGGGTAVTHLSTFTGNTGSTAYTIGDIVRLLKLVGLAAA